MKVLNLDAHTTPKRVVTFKGVKHDVLEISVQEFIDNLAAAERLEADMAAGRTVPLAEHLKESIEIVRRAVPTLPEEQVRALPLPALNTLLGFLRGDLDPAAESAAPAAATEEGDAAKKA